jgi:hypothetical protein
MYIAVQTESDRGKMPARYSRIQRTRKPANSDTGPAAQEEKVNKPGTPLPGMMIY